ncbi:MAG: peptidoglycan/xylan/chitin deacetylase (PgdA/CDA1 family) [Motiliproteus sp.]|jgi:peptidoglycan/xylan/chitin deacetylase (PgdA/CDA1 family)
MKTKVIFTVDTEPSIAGALSDTRLKPLIHEPVWGEVRGRSEALGFITRTLSQHQIPATFFVETLNNAYFGDQMRPYVEHLLDNTFDVQLHLHPVWLNYAKDNRTTYNDNCTDLPSAQLQQLIENGMQTLEDWTGSRPVAMRTGNFSASDRVFAAMDKAGISLSSNICVSVNPPKDAQLNLSGGAFSIHQVMELPATCFIDNSLVGRGRWRTMQITSCSADELCSLLDQAQHAAVEYIVLVTHPFEFIKKKGWQYKNLTRNALIQHRLERLCQHLDNNRDRFEPTDIKTLLDSGLIRAAAAPTLYGNKLQALSRAAQNLLNDIF